MSPKRKSKFGPNFLTDDRARHAIVDALGDLSKPNRRRDQPRPRLPHRCAGIPVHLWFRRRTRPLIPHIRQSLSRETLDIYTLAVWTHLS